MKISLDAIRAHEGYTQEEAAEHCGVTASDMKEFETSPGNMPGSIAMKLRELYGIPFDYISI